MSVAENTDTLIRLTDKASIIKRINLIEVKAPALPYKPRNLWYFS